MAISERTRNLQQQLVESLINDAGGQVGVDLESMTFALIEQFGHGIGRDLAAAVEKGLAERQAEILNTAHGQQYDCPHCGRPCRAEPGNRRLTTLDGEVEFSEPKCHCRRCRRTFFPSA